VDQPLAGLRVVDMADEKGELCGRLLADLGADVVRVEPPAGASSRRLPPRHGEAGLYFAVRNANKRGIVVDLASEPGRRRLTGLLECADVWIESTRPGALAEVGLDPGDVSARMDHLVVVSVTDFGQTGPYRDHVGTDPVLFAMSGMLFRSGTPDRPPLLMPGALAYDVAGIVAAFATLTAHRLMSATGKGEHIDVSVLEAAAQATDWSLANYSAAAAFGGLYKELRSGAGLYQLYPCADGLVRLAVISRRQWHALRAWLGEPEFLQDPELDGVVARMRIQADVLDPLYRALFADRQMSELAVEAQARGIPMTPVLPLDAVLATGHYKERGSFVEAEAAPGLTGPVVSGFFEMNGQRVGYRRPAPQLGQHDTDVSWGPRPVRPGRAGPPPPASNGPIPYPFRGLRVLDFGHGGVGVEAGRMLADYGADVIKIESRTYPDFVRMVAGSEMSASFASSNRSKRSFGVDLKTPEGRAVVLRLVEGADVVIENNSTGTMDGLGLGWDDLHAVNPELVMVSSQLMGSRGEWSAWVGYGANIRPASGLTWLWNFPDGGPPPGAQVIYPDHLAGRVCALGVLAALERRRKGGDGTHVEVAQVETVLGLLADQFLAEGLAPGSVGPRGNRSERGAPWGVFPCAGEQRWCVITCRDDDDWEALRQAMGRPAWASENRFASAAGRLAHQDTLDALIGQWTSPRSDRQVMEVLQAHGVPAGMMSYSSDQPGDPHLRARGYPTPLSQPGLGDVVLEGPAFHGSGLPEPVLFEAPALGQHTREIARDILGIDEAEVERLLATRVLEE
jgi:crotonobetainyl-CoA:carnitine CoA-transferase CaiB-like acyl-CoA transferase